MNIIRKSNFEKSQDMQSFFIVAGVTVMIPIIAIRFIAESTWNSFDFIVMGALLLITGSFIVLAIKKIKNIRYKAAAIILIVFFFCFIWAELAVDIIGSLFAGS